MLATPKGLSDEKAARMMVALREGRTLKKFGVKAPRLESYFAAHPEYAQGSPVVDRDKWKKQHVSAKGRTCAAELIAGTTIHFLVKIYLLPPRVGGVAGFAPRRSTLKIGGCPGSRLEE